MRCLRLPFLFLFLCAALTPRGSAQTTQLTGNLLTNPGAEAGSIDGWTVGGDGTPTVDSGTFDSGINPHTGSYDFLGHDGDADSLSQTVPAVTTGVTAAMIDAGTLLANVKFFEQGLNQGTPSDDAYISLTFLDVNGRPISSVQTPEVDSHLNGWERYTDSFNMPVGTRSITYTMNFVRHSGSDLDAFVDDNSLIIIQGTPGGLKVSPTSLDFGLQPYNVQSPAKIFTVSNPGTTTITFEDIILDLGANPFDFTQFNECPPSLAPGASCQVSITFLPHGVGPKSSGLQIDDDADASGLGVGVMGVGTGGILQVNPGNVKVIAGNGTAGTTGDGGPATSAEINQPGGIGFDPAGNLYIADTNANVVRKVTPTGIISTFAGTGARGFSGDGGPATQAQLFAPFSAVSDAAGNIYIQDTLNYVIRKVDTSGIITTYAGTPGTPGHSGDGGPANAARFNENQGARFDKAGNFFVPQCAGPSIRRIDTSGNISTVAGNFTPGFSGDGGPATSAQLYCPSGVTIDAAGNFYIADEFNQRIRKVDTTGVITTFAGTGTQGSAGDGGAATAAQLNNPNDVVIDAAGNLYIADSGNNEVRRVDANGVITTVAGGLQNAGSAGVNTPLSLTLDTAGNLYFAATGNSEILELFPAGTSPFPVTPVGTAAAPQTLTLSNIGNLPASIEGSGSFSTSGDTSDFALTGGTCLSGATLAPGSGTCTLQVAFTPTAGGLRSLIISVADDAVNSPQSFMISGSGAAAPTLSWPPPASIVYGTPLSATQLDAVATGTGGAVVAGTYAYTPAAGTVLGAGTQTLNVVFTSTDPNYLNATASVPITVTKAKPTIAWTAPATIPFGTALSAAQLDATATGVGGTALPGTYTYTPPAGTVLAPGTSTLQVSFAPTNADNYTVATGTTTITVTGLSLASFTPSVARIGDPATVITLTGSGFVPTSIVQVNGAAIATTYVSNTTLTAIVPATDLTKAATLQVTVSDPGITALSAGLPLMVINANPAVTLTGPTTTPPGSQPAVTLTVTNPYPFALTASFSLSFASAVTPTVDDPNIQFAAGGRTYTFTVPANSEAVPPILIQAGTVAGTITVPLTLTAQGVDVTPANLQPVVIVIPRAAPVISTTTLTRSGGQLSVAIHGFSNTREVTTATFHFVAASGASITTPDVTAPVTPLFTVWFDGTISPAYGSTFTYTQTFDVSDDAANIGSVQVTLTNSVGTSDPGTAK